MNATGYDVLEIPAGLIDAGDNDRRSFDAAKLGELALSISADGLSQPPTVRPMGNGRYQLVCGERRTRAMRDVLGWDAIPCIVREMSDDEAAAAMLSENTARVDLDPVEEARAYARRLEGGQTVAEVARTAGKSPATVTARVRLLALTPETLHLVSTRQIPTGHAVMMAGLDGNRQILACRAYSAERLDAVAFGSLCDRLLLEQGSESMFDTSSFMRAEEYAADAKQAAMELRAADPAEEIRKLRARVAELEGAGVDALLGVCEVADVLGVKERTVHMWQHRGRMPERDATVSGLPAWKMSTIVSFAARTGRERASA